MPRTKVAKKIKQESIGKSDIDAKLLEARKLLIEFGKLVHNEMVEECEQRRREIMIALTDQWNCGKTKLSKTIGQIRTEKSQDLETFCKTLSNKTLGQNSTMKSVKSTRKTRRSRSCADDGRLMGFGIFMLYFHM